MLFAENDCGECMPVLDTHEVVEDGVEGGREIVEEAREVHDILIDSPVDIAVGEVDISKPLDVKRSPRDEEGHNDSNWKTIQDYQTEYRKG